MKKAALTLAVVTAFFVPSAATATSGPGSIVLEVVSANLRGQYGKVWATLHPRYRKVTTRAFWEGCQRKIAADRAGVEFRSVKVIETYPDRVTLPVLGSVRVTAVTVEAKVEYLGKARTITDTVYVTKVGSRWYGLWEPETYRAYKAKRCPTG